MSVCIHLIRLVVGFPSFYKSVSEELQLHLELFALEDPGEVFLALIYLAAFSFL